MKTIFIVAGVLMTSASIYGVVDYNNKIHTKEFKELYKKEEPKPDVQTVNAKNTMAPLGTVSDETSKKETEVKTTVETQKPAQKKRKFNIREFSRAPLREKDIELPSDK